MKKLMFAAALVAATAAMAVESQVVGYQTKAVEAEAWYCIGCGFEKPDGQPFDISEFITGQSTDWDTETSALIMVPTSEGGLDTYNYIIVGQEEGGDDAPFISGWVLAGEGEPSSFPVTPGFACWFNDPNDVSITVAGAVTSVVPEGNETVLPADTWNMICNPFPVPVQMNGDSKFDCSEVTTDWDTENCCLIMYPTAEGGLDTYNYMIVGQEEGGDDAPFISGWVLAGEGDPAEKEIPAGEGFWIYNPYNDGKIVWKMN